MESGTVPPGGACRLDRRCANDVLRDRYDSYRGVKTKSDGRAFWVVVRFVLCDFNHMFRFESCFPDSKRLRCVAKGAPHRGERANAPEEEVGGMGERGQGAQRQTEHEGNQQNGRVRRRRARVYAHVHEGQHHPAPRGLGCSRGLVRVVRRLSLRCVFVGVDRRAHVRLVQGDGVPVRVGATCLSRQQGRRQRPEREGHAGFALERRSGQNVALRNVPPWVEMRNCATSAPPDCVTSRFRSQMSI